MNIKSKPHESYVFPRTKKEIRNRSVLAAMTNKQSHHDGTLSDEEINWLTRRAKDGFGIITTAATHLSLIHISEPTRRRGSRMPSSA